jgi:hypothetical protein
MMKKMCTVAAIAAVLVGFFALQGQAAVIAVNPVVGGWYDTGFNPIAPVPAGTSPGVPVIVQVDLMMQVLSLGAGEDSFGNAGLSIQKTGPLAEVGIGYQPNNPTVDSNGALPGGLVNMFGQNADYGADAMDLQGILASMATGSFANASDPRRKVGEEGPYLLGSVFMQWDGVGQATLSIDPLQVSAKLTGGAFVEAQAAPPAVLEFGAIPEPASISLVGMSLLGLALRRRS